MKALSLWQPWASLVVWGEKQMETRSWRSNHRGDLAIHAAQKIEMELKDMAEVTPFLELLAKHRISFADLPRGQLLGVVNLHDVIPTTEAKPSILERSLGNFTPGRFAWLLTWPRMLAKPVPFQGAQGLFEVPDELLKAPAETLFS